MQQDIIYKLDIIPSIDLIIDLYTDADLKRPVENRDRIEKMYSNSNLVVTAWENSLLIGISRAITDFCYCCYLSDLAVRKTHQKKGIGLKLIEITKEKSGDESMLLLLSAPSAMTYYPKIGLRNVNNAFVIDRLI